MEHAARLRFALVSGGQMRLDPNPESVSVPAGLSDDRAIALFRESIQGVLDLIERADGKR
jgi:hypothetical protein